MLRTPPIAAARARALASLASLAVLLVAGCATPAPMPAGTAGERAHGPQGEIAVARLELEADDGRRVPLRLAWPTDRLQVREGLPRGERLPLVVFSHGAYSSGEDYDAILDHWARHGYVVASPTHPDSTRLGTPRGDPSAGAALPLRIADLKLPLARLAEIERRVPALAGRVDLARVAATGHSYGGLIAQTLGGATLGDVSRDPTRTPPRGAVADASGREPRVACVVVFSGAGVMPPLLRPEDFQGLDLPVLVTVGTEDLAQAPGHTGYEWRRQPWDLAPPGDKYLLVLEGADHYLGGMVGRDDLPRSPRGADYVAAFSEVSLDFLDACVRGDAAARARLARTRVGDVGRLERK